MRLHNTATANTAAAVWCAFGFDVVEEVRRRVLPGVVSSRSSSRTHAGAR
jgi:hypothetical protein